MLSIADDQKTTANKKPKTVSKSGGAGSSGGTGSGESLADPNAEFRKKVELVDNIDKKGKGKIYDC